MKLFSSITITSAKSMRRNAHSFLLPMVQNGCQRPLKKNIQYKDSYLHLMIGRKSKNRLSDVVVILRLLRGGTNYASDSLLVSDPSSLGVSTYIWRLGHMAIVLNKNAS